METLQKGSDVAARVEALLARMSLAEKIGQLNQVGGADFAPGPKAEEQIRAGGAGSVLWLNNTKRFNELQKSRQSRKARPASRFFLPWMSSTATAPSSPCRWRWPRPGIRPLPEQAQSVAAREARAAGLHWTFAPMLDIARDARWGRIVEGAGEDPYLGVGHGGRPGARLPGR
jgi:beta-glucosidase